MKGKRKFVVVYFGRCQECPINWDNCGAEINVDNDELKCGLNCYNCSFKLKCAVFGPRMACVVPEEDKDSFNKKFKNILFGI